jgi:hypothetical protein
MDDERNHLFGLREQARRRLQPLEKRAAYYGIDVPAHVPNEIDDMRGIIASVDAQLGAIAALRLPMPVPDFVGRVSEIEHLAMALRGTMGVWRRSAACVGSAGSAKPSCRCLWPSG